MTAADPSRAPAGRPDRSWLLVALAALAPAVFALSSDNIWEDFFITYRCSLNLVHGHGFVFEPGRVLHVFTSPLGTLIPAGLSALFRTDDPHVVIDAFRVCACAALAAAWLLAAGRLESRAARAVAGGLWLLDPKLAAFSTNGMETAFLVLWVVLAWRALADGDLRLAGLALGGAMWTRPDGFVFVGALAASAWLLRPELRWQWGGWARLAGWALLLYLPWLLWAWWYYGSPVPHTILAKSGVVGSSGQLAGLVTFPLRLVAGRTALDDAFLPPYFYFGGWPRYLWLWGKLISLAALAAVCWPRCARPARIAGIAFLLGGLYLEVTPRAPWYFPAWQVLGYLAVGGLAAALADALKSAGNWPQRALGAVAAVAVAVQAALFAGVAFQLREQQRLIEWGVRASLGRDLREWARGPGDTVFLEPLGYIGFFSGLAMRDTPGLCSPEVVALRREGKRTMAELSLALRTDWVVLRDSEFVAMSDAERQGFGRAYRLWAEYDVRRQVDGAAFLPGRGFLRYDAHFLLWRRIGDDVPRDPR